MIVIKERDDCYSFLSCFDQAYSSMSIVTGITNFVRDNSINGALILI